MSNDTTMQGIPTVPQLPRTHHQHDQHQRQPQDVVQQKNVLAKLDNSLESLACLGWGALGSGVWFCRKRGSGRNVVLKIFPLNLLIRSTTGNNSIDCIDASDQHAVVDMWQREVYALQQLQASSSSEAFNEQRDDNNDDTVDNRNNHKKTDNDLRQLGIVYMEKYFIEKGVVGGILLKYVNGGTLADYIRASRDVLLAERRVVWYGLQLCEALAFCHERGVAHYDVKSANVLIDQSSGGKIVLADFGCAVSIQNQKDEPVGFTKSYAAPELLTAHECNDYTRLQADKVDAYGLGCILFELLCGQMMADLASDDGSTLADFVQQHGVVAAMQLPCLRLPWCSHTSAPMESNTNESMVVGYSKSLRNLMTHLLEPDYTKRWSPCSLQKPLRSDPGSPLIYDYLTAAQTPIPGVALTIDNIQLGMFVQRGPDWEDGDADGGPGKIGIVVKLDADGLYTEVAWPHHNEGSCCYRVGAGHKYELQIGPVALPDFFNETEIPRLTGLVATGTATEKYSIGQEINANCKVVWLDHEAERIFVAPTTPFFMESKGSPSIPSLETQMVKPRKSQGLPESWTLNEGLLPQISNLQEQKNIVDLFHAVQGGMNSQQYKIVSIRRVQSSKMWKHYESASEKVAVENWGIVNQRRLFLGTGSLCPETFITCELDLLQQCLKVHPCSMLFPSASQADKQMHHLNAAGLRSVVLFRVSLGREKRSDGHSLPYHSSRSADGFQVGDSGQAYPEYIITYMVISLATADGRRIVRVRRDNPWMPHPSTRDSIHIPPHNDPIAVNSSVVRRAATTRTTDCKMCVVCLTNPVSYILIPCGHPCLCELCASGQRLNLLKLKCPVCRQKFRLCSKIFGCVVDN